MSRRERRRRFSSADVEYADRVLATEPASLIGYWPMSEALGAVAVDLSPQGNDGAYVDVTLAQPGIGDGRTSALFIPGDGSYCNVYSAPFVADFNGAEGTAHFFTIVPGAGTWDDDTNRRWFIFRVNASNLVTISKGQLANRIRYSYVAGGTGTDVQSEGHSDLDWMALAITWSNSGDVIKFFKNGVQIEGDQANAGTWAGSIVGDRAVLGAGRTTPTAITDGRMQHFSLWKKAISPTQIQSLNFT